MGLGFERGHGVGKTAGLGVSVSGLPKRGHLAASLASGWRCRFRTRFVNAIWPGSLRTPEAQRALSRPNRLNPQPPTKRGFFGRPPSPPLQARGQEAGGSERAAVPNVFFLGR